jgi:hypothetical protein
MLVYFYLFKKILNLKIFIFQFYFIYSLYLFKSLINFFKKQLNTFILNNSIVKIFIIF